MKKNSINLAGILIFLVAASACTKGNENLIDEVKLTNGNVVVNFVMPASYKAKADADALMIVHCKYPTMEAADRDKAPTPETMSIHVVVSEKPSRTEFLVKKAAKEFDPQFPARDYFSGTEGAFQIYRAFSGNRPDSSEVVTYVFKGEDGVLVGVQDPGSWAAGLTAHRKIGPHLNIQYFIPRAVGKNFIEIDKKVVSFIKRHIKG